MKMTSLNVLAFLFANAFLTSSGYALTVEEVATKLDANCKVISRCSVSLKRFVKSVGASDRILQDFTDEQQVWIDKPSQRIMRRSGNGQQVWDCKNKITIKKVEDGVREEKYDHSIEVATPYPLAYVFYPLYVLNQFEIVEVRDQGGTAIVIGRPLGVVAAQLGQSRTELRVDLNKGVIVQVRTIDVKGRLVEDVRLKAWSWHKSCWIPRHIEKRTYSDRNRLTLRYSLQKVKVNEVDSKFPDLE